MNEAEARQAAKKLYGEYTDAFRLHYFAEKKASAVVGKLLAASEKARAAYYKAYNELTKYKPLNLKN